MSSKNIEFTVYDSAQKQFEIWKMWCSYLETQGMVKDIKCSDAQMTLTLIYGKTLMRKGTHVSVRVAPLSAGSCTIAVQGEMKYTVLVGTQVAVDLGNFFRPIIDLLEDKLGMHDCAAAYLKAYQEISKGWL
jgi:hypothetical protein